MSPGSMNRRKRNLISQVYLTIAFLSIILLASRCNQGYEVKFQEEPGTITGQIEDYDGVYITGKLSYWDAISHHPHHEFFNIDSACRY